MRQFLDVVHQAIELPLAIDLPPPAQREPIQPLVVPDVAEDRFDGGKASPVAGLAFFAVDGFLHPVAKAPSTSRIPKTTYWRSSTQGLRDLIQSMA